MARIRVGDHHWYGLGVPQEYSFAADHYRIAASNGDAKAAAQVNLDRSFIDCTIIAFYIGCLGSFQSWIYASFWARRAERLPLVETVL